MSNTSMPWVKLYTELLDDTKLAELPDQIKLRFIQLLLVAGECDADGCLINGDNAMTITQIAWRLRIDQQQLAADLDAMHRACLICNCDGAICITNFAKRQGRSQNERRERWRKNQQAKRAKLKAEPAPTQVQNDTSIPQETVIDDTLMSQRLREEKSREEKNGAIAPPVLISDITNKSSNVADATQPTPPDPVSRTDEMQTGNSHDLFLLPTSKSNKRTVANVRGFTADEQAMVVKFAELHGDKLTAASAKKNLLAARELTDRGGMIDDVVTAWTRSNNGTVWAVNTLWQLVDTAGTEAAKRTQRATVVEPALVQMSDGEWAKPYNPWK